MGIAVVNRGGGDGGGEGKDISTYPPQHGNLGVGKDAIVKCVCFGAAGTFFLPGLLFIL